MNITGRRGGGRADFFVLFCLENSIMAIAWRLLEVSQEEKKKWAITTRKAV